MVLSQRAKNEKPSSDEGLNFQRAASIKLNAKHDVVILTMSWIYHLSSVSFTQSLPKNIKWKRKKTTLKQTINFNVFLRLSAEHKSNEFDISNF